MIDLRATTVVTYTEFERNLVAFPPSDAALPRPGRMSSGRDESLDLRRRFSILAP
jgi:hypothetical protein